jgi:hypothetical protein
MNDHKKIIKYGVYSGLVASVIFIYFLDPIAIYLGRFALTISSYFFDFLSDRFYQEVALGKTDYAFIIVTIFVIGSLSFITSGILMRSRLKALRKRKVNDNQDETTPNENEVSGRILPTWLQRYVIPAIGLICIFLVVRMYLYSHMKIMTIDNFEQHMKILNPYLTGDETEVMISRFSSMKSESDYRKLYSDLDSIARINRIDLPKKYIHMY